MNKKIIATISIIALPVIILSISSNSTLDESLISQTIFVDTVYEPENNLVKITYNENSKKTNLVTLEILSISDDFPAPAGPVMPITTDLPDVLNIFLINFLDSFSSFSKIEIAFAIAPRFAFFKSVVMSKCDYLLFLR